MFERSRWPIFAVCAFIVLAVAALAASESAKAGQEPDDGGPSSIELELADNARTDDEPGGNGEEGSTVQILDHADDLFAGGRELARRTRVISFALASLLLALGVVLSLGGGMIGPGPMPARLIAAGIIGTIGIAAVPEIMDRTKVVCDAIAKEIDTYQFNRDNDGIASASVRTFHDMEEGIANSFQKAEFWSLLTSPITQLLMYIAWFLAIFMYEGYRFVWQVGWIALLIVGPFAMAVAASGTQMGLRIAKGWWISVLNLAVWPIAISILFALLNLGIHNYAQDPSSAGFKQALVAFIIALMIPVTLIYVKTFLGGGGLDTNLAGFAAAISGMATLTAIQTVSTLASHIPVVGGAIGRVGQSAKRALSSSNARDPDERAGGDGSGATSRGDRDESARRRVAPMPGIGDGHRTAKDSNGKREEQGVLAAVGDAVWETGAALGRTAMVAGAGIAHMANASMDVGGRDAGHIRVSSARYRPLPADKKAPTKAHGDQRESSPPKSSVTPAPPSSESQIDPDSTASQRDTSTENGRRVGVGTEIGGGTLGHHGSSSSRTSSVPPTEKFQAGSSDTHSANMTGPSRPPSLDDLGLGSAFRHKADGRADGQQQHDDVATASNENSGSTPSQRVLFESPASGRHAPPAAPQDGASGDLGRSRRHVSTPPGSANPLSRDDQTGGSAPGNRPVQHITAAPTSSPPDQEQTDVVMIDQPEVHEPDVTTYVDIEDGPPAVAGEGRSNIVERLVSDAARRAEETQKSIRTDKPIQTDKPPGSAYH